MLFSSIIQPVQSLEDKASKKLHNRFAIINPASQKIYIADYNQNWPNDDLNVLKHIKPEAYKEHADELPKYLRSERAEKLNLLYADEYQPENFIPYINDKIQPVYNLVH